MWHTGSVLRTDVFTYTILGKPWLNQQWGAELVFSPLFQAMGWKGLFVLQIVLVAGSFGVTSRMAMANGASAIVASCATLAGFAAAAALPGALALRPQLLALPLFIASSWIVRRRAERPARLLVLVPIGILWANTHGSFVVLSVLLAIALAADLVERAPTTSWTGALLAASIVAPLVSPWGSGVYRYVWHVSSSPIVRNAIAEWQPLLTRMPGALVFLLAGAAAIGVVLRRGRKPTLEEALQLATFTGLALWSGRNVLWWAVAVPPIVGALLAGWRPGGDWVPTMTRVVAAGLLIVALLGGARIASTSTATLLTEAPSGITGWLATHHRSSGRIFAEWWGGWFEYAIPNDPMFIDARVELFPDAVWRDYWAIVDVEPSWSEVVDRWDIDTIVLARGHHEALDVALRTSGTWSVAYEDADGTVFTRSLPT